MISNSDNAIRQYAGLWHRFLALFIDLLFLCAFFFPITRIVKGTWIMSVNDHRWVKEWFVTDPICLIFLCVMFGYFVLLEGLAGGTIGKMAVRIRVIDLQGRKPGLAKSLIRNLLRLIDGLPALNLIGILLILSTPERARFGDRVAETRVILKD